MSPATNEENGGDDTSSSTTGLLPHLREYKEFIAILVFFLGGFFWIYGVFETKEQVRILQCLTNQNIGMIQARMQRGFFLNDLTKKAIEYDGLSRTEDRSAEENQRMIRLKTEIETIKTDLKMAQQRYDQSFHDLSHRTCE